MNLLMACTKLDMMAKTSTSNCSMVDTAWINFNKPSKNMQGSKQVYFLVVCPWEENVCRILYELNHRGIFHINLAQWILSMKTS